MLLRDNQSPFNWQVVPEPVSVILLGPDGPCCPQISRALSKIKDNAKLRSDWVRVASDVAWFLNICHKVRPTVAVDFERSVQSCRAAMDCLIDDALKIPTEVERSGFDRRWVMPPPSLHRKLASALMSIGRITSLLQFVQFKGQDPAKIDNAAHALVATRGKRTADGRVMTDTLRRLRLGSNLTISPRFEDPRVGDRWLEGAARRGVPEVFSWLVRMAMNSGARSSSLLPANVAGLLLGAPKHGEIKVPHRKNKKRPSITLVIGDELYADFEAWVDSELRRWYQVDLEQCRRIADLVRRGHDGSESGKNRIAGHVRFFKGLHLFVHDGVPVNYDQLARVFRSVAVAEGLMYRPDRLTDRPRPICFHHLRHEYVFKRLEQIASLPAHLQAAEKRGLTSYMGWARREEMLEWYSHHYENLFGILGAHDSADEAERAFVGSTEPKVEGADVDPELEGYFA